jgi:hypothetical protein
MNEFVMDCLPLICKESTCCAMQNSKPRHPSTCLLGLLSCDLPHHFSREALWKMARVRDSNSNTRDCIEFDG